ncbi:MAG: CaiB/BaiF CoA-transferase family protein [Chloroflexi bacterium]|nr:CaiB/BaiF CoA-transferase family protein [Chloroflexota bacterium]
MPGPLHGIRILDLTRFLSGPYTTMLLGDLGADVIKVERPGEGDGTRGTGPFLGDGYSAYFMSVNRSKRSITIDLAHPKGKALLLDMAKQSDVLVENFVPGTMAKLGLDYPVIETHNPNIIYAAISGFGQSGPYAKRPALDIVVQAMGGIMSITGEPGGGPIRVGVSQGDIVSSLYCTIGILTALHERTSSGKGQMLDISMLECQIALLENPFARYFATGEVPQPLGTRHPVDTPFQAFATRDGWVVVAIIGEKTWPLFCSAIDRIDLADDERFTTGWLRTQHYQVLNPILSEAMRRKTTSEWLEELIALGIPCGPVNTIEQVAQNPQVVAREAIVEMTHPVLGTVKTTDTPIRLSRTSATLDRTAPELGQHTDETLTELLGLSAQEIEALRAEKVI